MNKQKQALEYALVLVTQLWENGEEFPDRTGRHSIISQDFGEMSEQLDCFAEELKESIAELETDPTPVAWMNKQGWIGQYRQGDATIPLYARPVPPKSVLNPLTDHEIFEIGKESLSVEGNNFLPITFARAIEKKLRGEL